MRDCLAVHCCCLCCVANWMQSLDVCSAECEKIPLRPELFIAWRKVLRLVTAAVVEGHRVHTHSGGKYCHGWSRLQLFNHVLVKCLNCHTFPDDLCYVTVKQAQVERTPGTFLEINATLTLFIQFIEWYNLYKLSFRACCTKYCCYSCVVLIFDSARRCFLLCFLN